MTAQKLREGDLWVKLKASVTWAERVELKMRSGFPDCLLSNNDGRIGGLEIKAPMVGDFLGIRSDQVGWLRRAAEVNIPAAVGVITVQRVFLINVNKMLPVYGAINMTKILMEYKESWFGPDLSFVVDMRTPIAMKAVLANWLRG